MIPFIPVPWINLFRFLAADASDEAVSYILCEHHKEDCVYKSLTRVTKALQEQKVQRVTLKLFSYLEATNL